MRFKVTGPHRVGGKRNGELVELDLTDQVRALIDGGHLAPAKGQERAADDEAAEDKEK